jgi:hypothetical protein
MSTVTIRDRLMTLIRTYNKTRVYIEVFYSALLSLTFILVCVNQDLVGMYIVYSS